MVAGAVAEGGRYSCGVCGRRWKSLRITIKTILHGLQLLIPEIDKHLEAIVLVIFIVQITGQVLDCIQIT